MVDVNEFLTRPLVAHLATAGPAVRPIWFYWDVECFWWLTGAWSRLSKTLQRDTKVALVIDGCDLASGEVLKVTVRGGLTS